MKLRASLATAFMTLAISLSTAHAQTTLYWDIDGTIDGAGGGTQPAGTWDTGTVPNWNTDPLGGAAGTVQTWADGDIAIFSAGTSATGSFTVSLSGPVTASGVTLEEGGTITLGVGGTLNFNPASTVSVATGSTLTLNGDMDGSGLLTKTGDGRFTLSPASNGFDGTYAVLAGSVNVDGDGRFGPVPGAVDDDYFLLNGGALRGSATMTLDANRGITLGAGGGRLVARGGDTMTYNGVIKGTAGGGLTASRVDALGTGFGAGNGVVLLGGANTYDGATNIDLSSTLRLAAVDVIPDGSVITMPATTGSGARFELGTGATFFNETVKSITGGGGIVAVGTGTLTLANPAGEVFAGAINASAGGKIIKNGSGTLSLTIGGTGSTGFNGEFVINDGTIGVGGSNIFGGASNTAQVTINGGKLSNTSTTASRSIPAGIAANLDGDFIVDDSLAAGTSGQILFGSANNTIREENRTITVDGAATNFGLGSLKEDIAGRGLTKDGDGILAFAPIAATVDPNVFTYTGDTTILAGTLRVSGRDNSRVGAGTGRIYLSGGKLDVSTNARAVSNPITNPITITDDSSITTSNPNSPNDFEAGKVNFVFSTSDIDTQGGSLTFRHEGQALGTNPTQNVPFEPRFTGSGFDITIPMAIENHPTLTAGFTRFRSMNAGGTQTYSGVISGNGSFIRAASDPETGGTTVLTGANTYLGGTSVFDGTLLVNNTSGSGTGSGAVTVGAGTGTLFRGTLGGTGSIDGVVTVIEGGTIAPGASVGTLTVGGLTLQSLSKLNFELDTPAASDLIDVTIATGLTINGGTVNITDAGGLGAGTYTLIDYNTSFGGLLSNLAVGTAPLDFTYILVNNAGNTSIDLVVSSAGLAGDYNDDGSVDAADYVVWRKHRDLTPNVALANDGGLGTPITGVHYNLWRTNFGMTNPGSGSGLGGGAVPEPASMWLLMLGVSSMLLGPNGFGRRRQS